MPVAAMLAGTVHQPLDLPLSQVPPFNCQIYDGWRTFLGCRFHADKPCLRGADCLAYEPLLHSQGVVLEPINTAGKAARAACYSGEDPPVGGTFQFQTFMM